MILRKRNRTIPLPDLESLSSAAKAVTGYSELVELFRRLPDTYRAVLEMKTLLGYSDRDIAKHLGISETAVSTRVSQGRALLREIAEKEGVSSMTDRELDTLMQRVLLDSLKLDWAGETNPQPSFKASPHHRREVRRMLANPLAWAKKRAKPVWKRAAQWAAVVLLVISLGFCGLMASSTTVRAAVILWVTEWYETHITYRYTGEDMAGAMPRYEITELPKDYAEIKSERIDWPVHVNIVYRNEVTGKTIYLDYMQMVQGGAADFVIEDSEILEVTVNGLDGQLFWTADWENHRNMVTWIDPDSELHFMVKAHLDKADILHIAESVSLVESAK